MMAVGTLTIIISALETSMQDLALEFSAAAVGLYSNLLGMTGATKFPDHGWRL